MTPGDGYVVPIEIKSGKTITSDFFNGLINFTKDKSGIKPYLIYGGNEIQKRSHFTALGFNELQKI